MVKKPGVVVMKSLSRKRRYAVLGLIMVVVVVSGVFLWRAIDNRTSKIESITSLDLEKRLEDGPPKDKDGKIDYYLQNSLDYRELGDNKKDLEQLLAADAEIKDRSLATGTSINLAIARVYAKLGENSKAKEYYQRELKRMEEFPDLNKTSGSYEAVVKEMDKL